MKVFLSILGIASSIAIGIGTHSWWVGFGVFGALVAIDVNSARVANEAFQEQLKLMKRS